MKFYTLAGPPRLGLGFRGRLIDWTAAAAELCPAQRAEVPADMLSLLRSWDAGLAAAQHLLAQLTILGATADGKPWSHAPDRVPLLAPVPRPGKILCSGINYRGHLHEHPGARLPTEPFFFAKMPSGVIGPGAPIVLPARSRQVDYEVEFAVVIGRPMKDTPEGEVMRCIAGYTILHDVSARDVQFKDNQITLGKNFDTFCPLGPCLVTRDEIPDPADLGLRSFVNGEIRQNGSNADWVFPLAKLLGFLSHVMTLEPGDVVSTGTPAGVGLFREPPAYLAPGDVVRLEIDGIGALENPVVAALERSANVVSSPANNEDR
jgi:2-keto-4-pentenoate hydratase/2-oxohepta-3-ene-1,7-dioic acid hydratase in catechol pathway